MTKKLLVVSTVAVFMFSSLAFAGGKGNGKAYSGSIGKGVITQTQTQTRTQIKTQSRINTNKGTALISGTGDMTRDRIQKRDGSCK